MPSSIERTHVIPISLPQAELLWKEWKKTRHITRSITPVAVSRKGYRLQLCHDRNPQKWKYPTGFYTTGMCINNLKIVKRI